MVYNYLQLLDFYAKHVGRYTSLMDFITVLLYIIYIQFFVASSRFQIGTCVFLNHQHPTCFFFLFPALPIWDVSRRDPNSASCLGWDPATQLQLDNGIMKQQNHQSNKVFDPLELELSLWNNVFQWGFVPLALSDGNFSNFGASTKLCIAIFL